MKLDQRLGADHVDAVRQGGDHKLPRAVVGENRRGKIAVQLCAGFHFVVFFVGVNQRYIIHFLYGPVALVKGVQNRFAGVLGGWNGRLLSGNGLRYDMKFRAFKILPGEPFEIFGFGSLAFGGRDLFF